MARRTVRLDVSVADGLAARVPRRADLRRWVEAVLARVGRAGLVSMRLMDEAEMRALNSGYRGRDKSTNVLSFPAGGPTGATSGLLGDLALCVPVIEREALDQGKTVEAHYAHLVVHGVLHLVGYDHERPDEAADMEAEEVAILAGLGFADPYRAYA